MSDIQQEMWFDLPTPEPSRPRAARKAKDPNPVIEGYGAGPLGAHCGTCAQFLRHRHGRKRYGKCRLRGLSHGTGTDHYATWPACGRYQPKEDPS